jgi:hypothetical protein
MIIKIGDLLVTAGHRCLPIYKEIFLIRDEASSYNLVEKTDIMTVLAPPNDEGYVRVLVNAGIIGYILCGNTEKLF